MWNNEGEYKGRIYNYLLFHSVKSYSGSLKLENIKSIDWDVNFVECNFYMWINVRKQVEKTSPACERRRIRKQLLEYIAMNFFFSIFWLWNSYFILFVPEDNWRVDRREFYRRMWYIKGSEKGCDDVLGAAHDFQGKKPVSRVLSHVLARVNFSLSFFFSFSSFSSFPAANIAWRHLLLSRLYFQKVHPSLFFFFFVACVNITCHFAGSCKYETTRRLVKNMKRRVR